MSSYLKTKTFRAFLFACSAALAAPVVAKAPSSARDEAVFDASLSSQDQLAWLKMASAQPNHVGSPHDKANAEWMLAKFKSWGWDAQIETYQVLYPRPLEEAVEMGEFKATLTEKPIAGDSSSNFTDPALPAYFAYQGDGDVEAPLVYVNYGTPEDYKQLALMGVSVKGKIVIARYGQVWRGVKPLLAQMHGAIGCIIYSDPADDGYATDPSYPEGASRPPQGIQRGSVMDMMLYPGDPLTPGVGATADAKRLTRETAGSIMKIPAVPISYADAQVLLSAMKGQVVPKNWRGALPITYRVAGTQPVHLKVKSDWTLQPIYNVIAKIKGSTWPDQWVVRGNHHDGWVAGADDPWSGMIPMMDEARGLGAMLKSGWRPKRTIVYASWDAEEPMLLGSTEWGEDHAEELREKAVLYLNTDVNTRGTLTMSGSQDLGAFMTSVAADVPDPEKRISVAERASLAYMASALDRDAKPERKTALERMLAGDVTLPISPAGSGSDFTIFLDHLGVPTLNLGFGGEGKREGIYHSAYDTYEHVVNFEDPGMVYGKVLAQTIGRAVMRAADSEMPLQSPVPFAHAVSTFVAKVKKAASDQRQRADQQEKLMTLGAWKAANDPSNAQGEPVPLTKVPSIDWSALDAASSALQTSAVAYRDALKAKGAGLSVDEAEKLQGIVGQISQTLLVDEGLPDRPWFRNVIYAPGRYIGYGATTLPAITESLTEEKWDQLPRMIEMTAGALQAYRARLDAATALMNS